MKKYIIIFLYKQYSKVVKQIKKTHNVNQDKKLQVGKKIEGKIESKMKDAK